MDEIMQNLNAHHTVPGWWIVITSLFISKLMIQEIVKDTASIIRRFKRR